MKIRILLKVALILQFCAPPEGPSSWLCNEARGQSEAWVVGNQWVRLGTTALDLPLQPLPQPGGLGNYAGQLASRSSTARVDHDGTLVFFAIDGNIYDGAGYRIADADMNENGEADDCVECVPPGESEILALPVPGSCHLYYVISTRYDETPGPNQGSRKVLASILDMGVEHDGDPCRKGRLLSFDDYDQGGNGPYQAFATWFFVGVENNDHQTLFASLSSNEGKAECLNMAAMDPGWSTNDHLLLHLTTENHVFQYRVTETGIFPNWSQLICTSYLGFGSKEVTRDTDFGRDLSTNEILFAVTDATLVNGDGENYRTLVLRMDATTGVVNETEGYLNTGIWTNGSSTDGTTGVYSCSFSPDGSKLYFTADLADVELGVIDRSTGEVTDLSDLPLNITAPDSWARTRLNRGKAPGGSADAIYYAKADGLAMLVSPNDPSSATWEGTVPFSATLGGIPFYVNPFDVNQETCVLMDALICEDQQSALLDLTSASPCCAYMSDVYAECDYYYTGNNLSDPWTTNDNGFSDPDGNGEILLAQDYVIAPGAVLALNGMTLRFAPNARLIVRPGGYARFNNCILTSYVCDGLRWPGIRVNGHTALDQTPIIGGDQGFLQLNNTTISNAEVGVLCATELTNGGIDVSGFGGIVYAYGGTTFKNCLIGADLGHYSANHIGGVENNRCYFANCHFITDADWPDAQVPQWHLVIQNTRKVDVNFCSFANDAPQLFPQGQTGNGILISSAEVKVRGSSAPTQTYVRNLNLGILNGNYLNTPVTVDRMHFQGNTWGLVDMGTLFGRYTNNTFVVPDQGTAPGPRVGMLLWQSQLYTVERNSFQGENAQLEVGDNAVGLYFLGYYPGTDPYDNSWVYVDSRIYDNTFTDLAAANLVRWIHRGNAASTNDAGLQMLCGDYTHNTFDQALLDQSIIKPTQGYPNGETNPQLGGNQYLDQASCDGDFDWWLDPLWNQIPNWYPDMTMTYYHHAGPSIEVDPVCEYPDYLDIPLPGSDDFDKPISCGHSVLDHEEDISEVIADHEEALELWADAQAALDGLVGAENETTLLQAINDPHPWTSSALRNVLLASSPVSDRVLTAVIQRQEPMDAWHITQVMTANCPLNRGVVELLRGSGLLSPFYMNLVDQAQQGSGPSTKQQLEEEVAVRRMERTMAISELGYLYGTDTTLSGGVDSLRLLILNNTDPQFAYQRMQVQLAEHDWSGLQASLAGPAGKLNGRAVFNQLAWFGQTCGGDWSQLSAAQKDSLVAWQEDGRSGAALCAGIVKRIGYSDAMPPVLLPRIEKALRDGSSTASPETRTVLAAYPNPAVNSTMLTWSAIDDGSRFELQDMNGRVLRTGKLTGNGVMELLLKDLNAGIYLLSVVGTNEQLRIVVTE